MGHTIEHTYDTLSAGPEVLLPVTSSSGAIVGHNPHNGKLGWDSVIVGCYPQRGDKDINISVTIWPVKSFLQNPSFASAVLCS